jgi:hypothetical protein
MLDEGIRADFELTVSRQIAKWNYWIDGGRGEPSRDGCERGRAGPGRTRQD